MKETLFLDLPGQETVFCPPVWPMTASWWHEAMRLTKWTTFQGAAKLTWFFPLLHQERGKSRFFLIGSLLLPVFAHRFLAVCDSNGHHAPGTGAVFQAGSRDPRSQPLVTVPKDIRPAAFSAHGQLPECPENNNNNNFTKMQWQEDKSKQSRILLLRCFDNNSIP